MRKQRRALAAAGRTLAVTVMGVLGVALHLLRLDASRSTSWKGVGPAAQGVMRDVGGRRTSSHEDGMQAELAYRTRAGRKERKASGVTMALPACSCTHTDVMMVAVSFGSGLATLL